MRRSQTGTYRVQLHSEFGFDAASKIADYLRDLGVSHFYSSPYLQAAPGSKHGYDVVDHHRVNEELGGSEAHERFCKHLGACGLGQLLDIVPNHMAISGRRNRLWWDVLENGPSSRYAQYFDIDWAVPEERLRNKLLVPILGDHYGRVLNRGEIQLERRKNEFLVKYFDHELPMAPKSLPSIFSETAKRTGSDFLAFIADGFDRLPAAADTDEASMAQRQRDKVALSSLLARLFEEVPFIAETVDAVLADINRAPDHLDAVLEQQNFRLAYWRTSDQDLGYRRFFDVNTLVGLRMEDERVFTDTHALILNWLREGVLDGIRVDHPDGLRDPEEYFSRLRANAPDVWILAEKILEPGEAMRRSWPIDGTTGYDFLNEAGGVLIDETSEEKLTSFYAEFTGAPTNYAEVCHDKKNRVLRDLLGSDINRLTSLFKEICEQHRDRRDFTRQDILRAIRELTACFPVYRTYVVPDRDEISDEDERYVSEAVDAAKAHRTDVDAELFDFLRDVLLLRARGPLASEFLYRFQQFCGPAMAKGVEDTTFYNYNRLISLNEVGGDPGVFGITPERFHELSNRRQQAYPRGMLASSTHDTKRSEDVRARIDVIAEMPEDWAAAVRRWAEVTEKYRTKDCPDRNTQYFLFQTMLGAWPIGTDRLLPYMEKACREAKAQTSWLAPNEEFESATKGYIEALYEDREFLDDFEGFVNRTILPGRINALCQTLLKLTAPGVPDTYQGAELWDLSLVDPDNRRPVDYELRRRLLKELNSLEAEQIWKRIDEGLPKLWLISKALHLRQDYLKAFGAEGSYERLVVSGCKSRHAIAYLRGGEVAAVATRLPMTLRGDWGNTCLSLSKGKWQDIINGRSIEGGIVRLQQLLSPFPVSLLVKQ